MALQKLINRTLSWFDQPHEKFIANVFLMFLFWIIYYSLYTSDQESMIINPDTITRKDGNLNIFDFAWFATITQFGITFGDIVPKSQACKMAVMLHAFSFWLIALS